MKEVPKSYQVKHICFQWFFFYDSKISFQPVAGVIGASFSGVSIMVANILKLFRVSHPLNISSFSQKTSVIIQMESFFHIFIHFLSLSISLCSQKQLLKLFVSSPFLFCFSTSAGKKDQWSTFPDSTDQLCLHISGALWQVQVGIYDLDGLDRRYFIAFWRIVDT